MDALKAAGLCALLASPPQAGRSCEPVVQISSPEIDRWRPLIAAASARFGIPAEWIRAVVARESAGLTALHGAPIVSSAGAMGLMQLMPGTWSELRARYGLGNDPFDPRDNIFAGAAYLREMFDRYGYPNLFAAYHAGPGRMHAYLSGRKSLPAATKTYLESIVSGAKSTSDLLFFEREDSGNASHASMKQWRAAQGLFVPLASQQFSPDR